MTVQQPAHCVQLLHFHVQLLTALLRQQPPAVAIPSQLPSALLRCAALHRMPNQRQQRDRRLLKVATGALQALQFIVVPCTPAAVSEGMAQWLLDEWTRLAREAELWLASAVDLPTVRLRKLVRALMDGSAQAGDVLQRAMARRESWPYYSQNDSDVAREHGDELVALQSAFLSSLPLLSLRRELGLFISMAPLLLLRCRSPTSRLLYASMLQQLLLLFPAYGALPLSMLPLLFDADVTAPVVTAFQFLMSTHPASALSPPTACTLLDQLTVPQLVMPSSSSLGAGSNSNGSVVRPMLSFDPDTQPLSKRRRLEPGTAVELPLTSVPDTVPMLDSLSPEPLLRPRSSPPSDARKGGSPAVGYAQQATHDLLHRLLTPLLALQPLKLPTASLRFHFTYYDTVLRICLPSMDRRVLSQLQQHGEGGKAESVTSTLLRQLREWIAVTSKLALTLRSEAATSPLETGCWHSCCTGSCSSALCWCSICPLPLWSWSRCGAWCCCHGDVSCPRRPPLPRLPSWPFLSPCCSRRSCCSASCRLLGRPHPNSPSSARLCRTPRLSCELPRCSPCSAQRSSISATRLCTTSGNVYSRWQLKTTRACSRQCCSYGAGCCASLHCPDATVQRTGCRQLCLLPALRRLLPLIRPVAALCRPSRLPTRRTPRP